ALAGTRLSGRVATYTSISGPPLDHVALWTRRHLRPRLLGALLRQAARSWYVGLFHVPGFPRLVALGRFLGIVNRRRWSSAMTRMEGIATDPGWPAPTFSDDVIRGIELYRANIRDRFRDPLITRVELPVQIIVPLSDRYVTPALLDGLEEWSETVWRREIRSGHWVIRSQPDDIVRWIRELVRFGEGEPDAQSL
ncbi:MAG: SDR family oxidoreductase, partial [Acidimicrobiales bacterium]